LKTGVSLKGEGASVTIIDGGGGGPVVQGSNGSVKGFTIRNSGATYSGIFVTWSDYFTISNNLIINNGAGIYCHTGAANTVIDHNTIVNNSSAGILESSAATGPITIKNNIITGNTWGINVSHTPTLLHNDVWNNTYDYSGANPGPGDISLDPLFCSPGSETYTLQKCSPCLGAGEGGSNIGVFGQGCLCTVRDFYVSKNGSNQYPYNSWEIAAHSIQDAINIAQMGTGGQGGFVHVAQGTYEESITMKKGVILFGGYNDINGTRDYLSYKTIIDPPGKSSNVVTGASNSWIDGFVIQGGKVGIYCLYDSNFVIQHNLIRDNAERGIVSLHSSLTIRNNDIVRNGFDYQGSALYIDGSTDTIVNNTIWCNHIGILAFGGANLVVHDNIVLCNFSYEIDFTTAASWDLNNNDIGYFLLGSYPGGYRIAADPLFFDPSNDDYRLHTGSPCWLLTHGAVMGAHTLVVPSGLEPPSNVTVSTGEEDELIISWASSEGASGYYLYYGDSSKLYTGKEASEGHSPIDVGNDTFYTLTNLVSGRPYYIAVSAYSQPLPDKESEVSQEKSATPHDTRAPAAVTNFKAVSGDEQAILSWRNPDDCDFVGTMIRYSTSNFPENDSDGELACLKPNTPGSVDTFVHRELTNGQLYFYTAFAYDEVPNYPSAVVSAQDTVTPRDTIPPAAPTNFTAVAGDGEIFLTWANPTDADFAGTKVVRKTGGYPSNPNDGTSVYSGADNHFNDTGLTNYITYYYTAFAYDEVPNYSSAVVSAQDSATPQDVTPPQWTDGVGARHVEPYNAKVTIYWNKATDTCSPPVKYNIYYNTRSPAIDGIKLSHVTPTSGAPNYDHKYTITGLTNGELYYFTVRAEDSAPNPNEDTNRVECPAMPEYYTPGTGISWNLDDMIDSSQGGIRGGGGIYTMHGSVTISQNDTLTINPGDMLISVDTSGTKSLIVEGTLVAAGNQAGIITFTSQHGESGDWRGIFLDNPGPGTIFDFCLIECAVTGIHWQGSSPIVTNCLIQNNLGTGIYAFGTPASVTTIFRDTIQNNGSGIIVIADSSADVVVLENTVKSNAGNGIGYSWARLVSPNILDIGFNTIWNNGGAGISCGRGGSATFIHDNTITENLNGIVMDEEAWGAQQPVIKDNVVSSNKVSGIHCANRAIPNIIDNIISSNLVNGIYCRKGAWPGLADTIATGNTITNSKYGIFLEDSSGIELGTALNPGNNNIHTHSIYSVYNNTPNNINAQGSWWGAITTQQMDNFVYPANVTAIYDGQDQPALGTVDYRNWLHRGNTIPTITLITPPTEGAMADTLYTIIWMDSDPEENAQISLYYDTDNVGLDGTPIQGGSNISEDDPTNSFDWNTTNVPAGTYYIYAIIDDGWSTSSDYSDGALIVGHPDIRLSTHVLEDTLIRNTTDVKTLVISNVGAYPLSYSIEEGQPVDWLSESPTYGTINPGNNVNISIAFNTNGLYLNTYSVDLLVQSNDPDKELDTVSVILYVKEPQIALSDSTHNYGYVVIGDSKDWSFHVMNLGNSDLIIDSVSSSNPSYSIISPTLPETIPPSDTIAVMVRFTPSIVDTISATLSIVNNDPDEPTQSISLTGIGMDQIVLSDTAHDFAEVIVTHSADWTFNIANGDTANLVINNIVVSSICYRVVTPEFPQTILPGDDLNVTIQFTPTFVATFTCTLTISTNNVNEPLLHVTLTGEGIQPNIGLSAYLHVYDTTAVGAFDDWQLLVLNQGNCNLTVYDVSSNNVSFVVMNPPFPQEIAKAESLVVNVRFVPDTVGLHAGILTVSSDDPYKSSLTINLSGYAVSPEISLSRESFDFGDVVVGSPLRAPVVTILNEGSSMLIVDSIINSNIDYVVEGTFPQMIEPESSYTVRVTFTPSKEGIIADTLVIFSNDLDESRLKFNVKGAGVIPDISLSVTELNIELPFGEIKDTAFVVSNKGTGVLIFDVMVSDTPVVYSKVEYLADKAIFSIGIYKTLIDKNVTSAVNASDSAWLTARPETHTISQGDSALVEIKVETAGLAKDTAYTAYIIVSSNDPDESIITIPITLLVVTGVEERSTLLGTNSFGLAQCYPNPFIQSTVISYWVPKLMDDSYGLSISLKIFDLSGRLVRTLVNEQQKPGYYKVNWDGKDDSGRRVTSGIYFYRLDAYAGLGTSPYTATRKLILLR
ncbi:MAG TPA: choice-of-anchor D domain-containing protein, partial [bacterium (Candidatus Stahlbacteria)]|nr:choice-of-anchor D domain-containing protein [Candidatus Stahlbacteria bacterium]